jgi:uncharacterized membrane protein
MRIIIIACLLFLLSGCVALTQMGGKQTLSQSESFHTALDQLFKKSDLKPMQAYMKKYPDSIFSNDAKQIMQLHKKEKSQHKKLQSCNQQLSSSTAKLIEVQTDIERLTQLLLKK